MRRSTSSLRRYGETTTRLLLTPPSNPALLTLSRLASSLPPLSLSQWDKDNSGTLDYTEVNKALRKGMSKLRDELEQDETPQEEIQVSRGERRAQEDAYATRTREQPEA